MYQTHPFIETHPAHAAFAALDAAASPGGVSLLVGPSGSGKSSILAEHARRACEVDAASVLVVRAEVMNTPLSLVRSLLGRLGLTWHGSTRGGLDVLELLLAQAGVRMLAVDDAILLTRPTLETLRLLGERTGVALVLAGGSHLLLHLRQRCAPLLRAVRHLHEVAPLTLADVLALMGPSSGMRGPASWRWQATAQALLVAGDGNVRRVLHLFEDVQRLAWEQGVLVSPDLVACVTPARERVA